MKTKDLTEIDRTIASFNRWYEQEKKKMEAAVNDLQKAEKFLAQFRADSDAFLTRAKTIAGDAARCEALRLAGQAYRRAYAYGCALADASGRAVYRPRWDWDARLGDDHLRRLWQGIKHSNTIPAAPLPKKALATLERIKAATPAKPAPVAPAEEPYESQTGADRESGPSRE
jgi:hypothetical protein